MVHKVTRQENQIILASVDEVLTLEDWANVSQQIANLLDEDMPEERHVIVDMSRTQNHPINAVAIKKVTVWVKAPNLASIYHVVNNRYTAMLGDAVIGLFTKNYNAVYSLDEAYADINK